MILFLKYSAPLSAADSGSVKVGGLRRCSCELNCKTDKAPPGAKMQLLQSSQGGEPGAWLWGAHRLPDARGAGVHDVGVADLLAVAAVGALLAQRDPIGVVGGVVHPQQQLVVARLVQVVTHIEGELQRSFYQHELPLDSAMLLFLIPNHTFEHTWRQAMVALDLHATVQQEWC